MANQDPKFMVTGEVRVSYVHLFKAYANPNNADAKPKFSTTILIPKSDIATRQRMDLCMNAATQEGIANKWNNVRPPVLSLPLYDGDGVRPNGDPFSDECRGHWVMTASTEQMPEVIDLNMNPIINQSEVYSGMYARVSIRFFPYLKNGKRGIGCGLGNVQKTRDGEPLGGGRTSAVSDFGGAVGEAFAAPTYQQQGYAPPAQPSYQQPNYGQPAQPVYAAPAAPVYAQQPVYAPPVQMQPQQQPQSAPMQIDPITGRPLLGGVMGL